MASPRSLLAPGLAALVVLVGTAAASAAPGYATGHVNVRSGPSTGYHVVDVLRRGERIDIRGCRGSWCRIEHRGPDGWVSANYLSVDRGWDRGWDDGWDRPPPPRWTPRPPRTPRPPVYHAPYPDQPHVNFCINSPHAYFCAGN